MDREIAGYLAEASDPATPAKRLSFLFSTALEMRKRLDLPEEQFVRWGEIARRCAVNPMADVDLVAAGFAAGYVDTAHNPALPFHLLEDPSAKRLFQALIRQHGLEVFADAEMPPDVLGQVWRLAMGQRDVPWGAAGLLANPRIPVACLEDAKRRVGSLPSRSVGAAESRCLEGLVLRPDQDLASRRGWMRRIVADDPGCGDVCADLASSFGFAGRAAFVDPELFRLLCEGLERGLEEQGNIEAWRDGRDAMEVALKDRRSGAREDAVLAHLPSEAQLVQALAYLEAAKEAYRGRLQEGFRKILSDPWCRSEWGSFQVVPEGSFSIRLTKDADGGGAAAAEVVLEPEQARAALAKLKHARLKRLPFPL